MWIPTQTRPGNLSGFTTIRSQLTARESVSVVAGFSGAWTDGLQCVTACMFYIEGIRIAFPSIDTKISDVITQSARIRWPTKSISPRVLSLSASGITEAAQPARPLLQQMPLPSQ